MHGMGFFFQKLILFFLVSGVQLPGGGGADDWDRGVRDPLQPRLHPLLHPAEQPEDFPQARAQNTEKTEDLAVNVRRNLNLKSPLFYPNEIVPQKSVRIQIPAYINLQNLN